MLGEVLPPDLVNRVEVLHVPDIHVHSRDIGECPARRFHGGLEIPAHLVRLRGDVTDAGDSAFGVAGGHSGNEDKPCGGGNFDRRGVGEVPVRLSERGSDDSPDGHGILLDS